MKTSEEPTFLGVWDELYAKRKTQWVFDADDRSWEYDSYSRILRIRHLNLNDDVYEVRMWLDNWAMLTDVTTRNVTCLRR